MPNTIFLVFDAARSHISQKVKAYLHSKKILFAVIPGGLTGLLQPCDVVWFKQLKHAMEEMIDQWKRSPNHEHTRAGNVRPPSNEDITKWLSDSWASIPQSVIRNSFDRCFMGDSLYLHVAQHELYGEQFRETIARLAGSHDENIVLDPISEESELAEIDDE